MILPLEGANRVRGAWTRSLGAGRFEVRAAADPVGLVGSFPASDERDVQDLFDALPPGSWAARTHSERVECLLDAAEYLENLDGDPVAATLGLSPAEGAGLRRGFVRAVENEARGPKRVGLSERWVLCAPHWTELELPLFRSLLPELLAGSSIAVFGDRRLPVSVELLVRALVDSGVGENDVTLLHAPSSDALDLALGHGNVGKVMVKGTSRLVARVRRATSETIPQVLTPLRNVDFEIHAESELEPQARRLVSGAFGRTTTLSGQASGQVTRVHCPDSVFSRFTELFLSACEDASDVRTPLAQIDRDAVRVFDRRLALGLDEGATLIQGQVEDVGSRLCLPAIFTNVEHGMELWRKRSPAPICLLSRAD